MNERPIIMTAESVLAILSGLKTQTRRVIKNPPSSSHPDYDGMLDKLPRIHRWRNDYEYERWTDRVCPYGQPGDRLWVRETWGITGARLVDPCINYKAGRPGTDQIPLLRVPATDLWATHLNFRKPFLAVNDDDLLRVRDGWRSSMFMPRWASRITLELTGIRSERVQEISGADVLAEGLTYSGRNAMLEIAPVDAYSDAAHLRNSYWELWESINSKRGFGWKTNPWVWCLSFRRI